MRFNDLVAGCVMVIYILIVVEWSGALEIRVSTATGHDNKSCLLSSASGPCKTVGFALNAMEDEENHNQTLFIFQIEDHIHSLDKRINISQTNPRRGIVLQSSHANGSIIRCTDVSAGFDIGSRVTQIRQDKTRNISIENLKFQQCGPRFAATVLIWNSVKINFRNCVFEHNKQAGINAFDSEVTIESCIFQNNTSNGRNSSEKFKEGFTSAGGAAGFLFRTSVPLSVVITNSTFTFNSAVTNDSASYIAPSSNVSHFTAGGGGLLVVFLKKTEHCRAVIEDSKFSNNSATYGGGFYFADSNSASKNNLSIIGSHFVRNRAGQTGGGLIFSQWDNASSITSVIRNCTVKENKARRGAGVNVFLMNYDDKPNDSVLRFDNVVFSDNRGDASTAIRFTTALPYGSTMDVTPEFINCKFENHNMSSIARTSPFTSQRVNVRFQGSNIFQRNYGGGAGSFQDCVLHVEGQLVFANNTGSHGGALFLQSSQMILYPGSELMFLGNKADGIGGAILVWENIMSEFIHEFNPNCFLAYSDHYLPPSKWKTNVSFIENSSRIKGAAIYISSLQRCVWIEEAPYHDPQKALRWSSNILYRNNSLVFDGVPHVFSGTEYDIATDTKNYNSTLGDNSTVKLAPGQKFPLNLQGVDELGHSVYTTAFVAEEGSSDNTSKLMLSNVLYVLSPNKSSTVSFSFNAPETVYNEAQNRGEKNRRRIQFVDIFSTLPNGYSFEVELQTCPPGFNFNKDTKACECNRKLPGISRCENGHTVYLKEGYWANVTENGTLVTYYCPYKYCKCTHVGELPGCLFDPANSIAQCAKNREGWLCGKCSGNTSVGLRWNECVDCPNPGWVLGVVIPLVMALCVLIIWLNPGISSELRGPLYFFQVLPCIFDPTSQSGSYIFLLADLFNFGGPLVYLTKTCIVREINNLYSIAFGYLVPFLALLIFLFAYLLSINYCLRFKFRQRSMLKSFWLLVVFIYNYCVETSFLILFCPKVGDSHVFFYDGTVECFYDDHLPMAILAILVLVFLVIPPPIMVFLLTNGYWRVDPQYLNTLTSGLRPERRWWWSVDLCRRVLVVGTYAFVPNWQTKKILMILMCVLILAVHSNSQPYLKPRVNFTESVYLLVLATLAVMQIVEDEMARYGVSLGLVFTVALHALVVTVYKGVRFFRKRFEIACARRGLEPNTRHRDYDQLEDTEIDQNSLDAERERQRNIMDTIFNSPSEGADHDSD